MTRSIAEIDAESSKLNKTVCKLEADSKKNDTLLQRVTARCEAAALPALSGTDPIALDKLTKARKEKLELALMHEDYCNAIGAAKARLDALKIEYDAAKQEESWAKFVKLQEKALAEAELIYAANSSTAQLLKDHNNTLRQLTMLASEAGKPKQFRFAILP
jgi:hypothetical protein